MKDDMQVHNMAVLTGDNLPLLVSVMETATDSDHILVMISKECNAEKEATRKAMRAGNMAGILFSRNPRFVVICARVAFNLGPRDPLPIPDGCLRLELSGKPLERLLRKAEKYDSLLKEKALAETLREPKDETPAV